MICKIQVNTEATIRTCRVGLTLSSETLTAIAARETYFRPLKTLLDKASLQYVRPYTMPRKIGIRPVLYTHSSNRVIRVGHIHCVDHCIF